MFTGFLPLSLSRPIKLDVDCLRAFLAAAGTRAHQAVCALHGHESLLQLERDRVWLRCAACGRETPGWNVENRLIARQPPRNRFRANSRQ